MPSWNHLRENRNNHETTTTTTITTTRRKGIAQSLWNEARRNNYTDDEYLQQVRSQRHGQWEWKWKWKWNNKSLWKAVLYECQPIDFMSFFLTFADDDDGRGHGHGHGRGESHFHFHFNNNNWNAHEIQLHFTNLISQCITTMKTLLGTIVIITKATKQLLYQYSSWSTYGILLAITFYWKMLMFIHDALDAGPLVLILTILVLIFTVGLGDRDENENENENGGRPRLSAYAVFNQGFQNIMGSMDMNQLVAQHVGGGFMMGNGGGHGDAGAIADDHNDFMEDAIGDNDDDHDDDFGRGDHVNNNNDVRDQHQHQHQNQQDNSPEGYDETINHHHHQQQQQQRGKSRKSNKKQRRKRDVKLRREMQEQRQAAIQMGFGAGDADVGDDGEGLDNHHGNLHQQRQQEAMAMNRLVEDQVIN